MGQARASVLLGVVLFQRFFPVSGVKLERINALLSDQTHQPWDVATTVASEQKS